MNYLALGIGLVLGLVIGWLLGARRSATRPADGGGVEGELRNQITSREHELTRARAQAAEGAEARATAEARQKSAEAARTEAVESAKRLEAERDDARRELAARGSALATAEARVKAGEELLAEARRSHDRALAEARAAQEKALADLREAFKAMSAEALKQNAPEFLRLAEETFKRLQEGAKGDLAQRQEAIATLVKPLEAHLKTYQERLQQSETTQSTALGEVRKHLETLAQQSQSLSSETLQLRRVLSSNQARGRWGEETLRRVVEAAGLSAHCDFTEQTQEGDGKPDLVVRLPGERVIVVDAKVPDLEFLAALEASDATTRAESLAAHAAKMRETIKALAARDYPAQFPQALDHVVLFVPAESLFSAALEGDRDLIVWAASKRILLATPASLIALLRSVAVSWQQHGQTENAREIAAAAQELFARVVKFTEHLDRVRTGLETAGRAFNEAVGSYESRVRPAGARIASLGAGAAGKEMAELAPVPEGLRGLVKE